MIGASPPRIRPWFAAWLTATPWSAQWLGAAFGGAVTQPAAAMAAVRRFQLHALSPALQRVGVLGAAGGEGELAG